MMICNKSRGDVCLEQLQSGFCFSGRCSLSQHRYWFGLPKNKPEEMLIFEPKRQHLCLPQITPHISDNIPGVFSDKLALAAVASSLLNKGKVIKVIKLHQCLLAYASLKGFRCEQFSAVLMA